jgi:hypothetical protein
VRRSLLLAAILTAAHAPNAVAGRVAFGASEDATKYSADGASLFSTMRDAGLTVDAVSIHWDPADPATIQEQRQLDRLLPAAEKAGVRVVFHVYPGAALALARRTKVRIASFVRFLRLVAQTYPGVTDYIVGNEPNQPRFMRPQFSDRGRQVSAGRYERLLAASYDALKSENPDVNVIGVALSPRGNDNPRAPENISTSPVRFLRKLGDAYHASGRRRPLMDQLAFHPYPNVNTDPPAKGYVWPNAGLPNLNRIKQAVWDAFHGTAQPTFAEAGNRSKRPLTLVVDELAWQVGIPVGLRDQYTGRENVPVVSEAVQARYYASALAMLRCDPAVTDVYLFRFVDQPDLDRFQSGLLRIDGSKRPAFDTVQETIAEAAACARSLAWRHTTGVIGAKVGFRLSGTPLSAVLRVRAAEATTVTARLVRVGAAGSVFSRSGPLPPRRMVELLLPRQGVGPGLYRYVVELRAETNRARRSVFASPAVRLR